MLDLMPVGALWRTKLASRHKVASPEGLFQVAAYDVSPLSLIVRSSRTIFR